ncbi:UDP-N-acetylmuramoyl-tripeptide--D-alanyl-D-alanine ligase [Enterobacteriaceae bacterium LUAb1]
MIALSLHTLAEITQGEVAGLNREVMIDTVTTDTRKITPGCLFIALQGERFDAHDFSEQAADNGAAALLVSKRTPVTVPQVIVADTRIALGQLGAWVRQQSPARVVALTGSSGKTSVKEMTAAILRECGNTLHTAGNLNNDIGVPLTLLRLTSQHQFAVIELGANHPGEIACTAGLTRPESALINNLAPAHLEGFGSLSGVAKAKGEIFTGLTENGTAIVNLDSHDLTGWQPVFQGRRLWRFSATNNQAEFYARQVHAGAEGTCFTLCTPQGEVAVTLPLPGRHNIANALAAAALALSVGAPLAAIAKGLRTLQPVPGRLFPVWLNDTQLLLDDSYNANVGSMIAATDVLREMPGYRIMVAGDMGELGKEAEECHRQVGEALRKANIDKVLSVGKLSQLIGHASGVGEHFADKAALTARLQQLLSEHTHLTVLVKGSRSSAMEQIVHTLKEKGLC